MRSARDLSNPYNVGFLQGYAHGHAETTAKCAVRRYAQRYADAHGLSLKIAETEIHQYAYRRAHVQVLITLIRDYGYTLEQMVDAFDYQPAWIAEMAVAANLDNLDYTSASNDQLLKIIDSSFVDPLFRDLPGVRPAWRELYRRNEEHPGSILPNADFATLLLALSPEDFLTSRK